MSYLELLKLAAPEAILVVTALTVLAVGLTSKSSSACSIIAIVGLIVAIGAVLRLPHQTNPFGGMLVISPLNSLFTIICLAMALATVLLATSARSLPNYAEYLAMILFATVGLTLLVASEELLMIFIGLELLGLSLYVLTAFNRHDMPSSEAGLKYLLFGSTASAFTLFGISLIYGTAGTTSLAQLASKLGSPQPLLAVALVMTLIGFAFKIAVAPFHLWAPDVYQAAPIPSGAFIASGSKVASFVVLGKIVLIGFASVPGNAGWHAFVSGWSPILALLAAFSILLGNFVALAQSNVRRLLAYSAVAHAGYTLLGIIGRGPDGFSATLFYTTTYAITLVGAFAVCGAVRDASGGDDIKNFTGLVQRSPSLALCMLIFLLSLAGIPPLAGFFGKFYLFSVALHGGGSGLVWLVAVALFGSFISLYYYLLVLKAVFVDPPSAEYQPRASAAGTLVVAFVTAAALIVIGCSPAPLVKQILSALS